MVEEEEESGQGWVVLVQPSKDFQDADVFSEERTIHNLDEDASADVRRTDKGLGRQQTAHNV